MGYTVKHRYETQWGALIHAKKETYVFFIC